MCYSLEHTYTDEQTNRYTDRWTETTFNFYTPQVHGRGVDVEKLGERKGWWTPAEEGWKPYVIDQAWGEDGWILVKLFCCVVMDRNEGEVYKKTLTKTNGADIEPSWLKKLGQ